MLKIIPLFFLMYSFSSYAATEFIDSCIQFKDEMRSISKLYGTNLDLKYSGSISLNNDSKNEITLLQLGKSSLKIPFVGDEVIALKPSVNTLLKESTEGRIIISFYQAGKYKNVVTEFLGDKDSSIELFDGDTYHDWLVYKGFEHSLDDLLCSGDYHLALKMMAYISAKAPLAENGAMVFKLNGYETGFVQINLKEHRVTLVLVEGENVLNIIFEAKTNSDVLKWLGLQLPRPANLGH